MTLTIPEIHEFVDEMVLMSLDFQPACESDAHEQGTYACVPEQPASYVVTCPCGHTDLQCAGSAEHMLVVFTIWCDRGCGKTYPAEKFRIMPLELM